MVGSRSRFRALAVDDTEYVHGRLTAIVPSVGIVIVEIGQITDPGAADDPGTKLRIRLEIAGEEGDARMFPVAQVRIVLDVIVGDDFGGFDSFVLIEKVFAQGGPINSGCRGVSYR